METILAAPDINAAVADLAKQLNITEADVLRRAVHNYSEKIKNKKRLMSFAGILSETEADDLLLTIRNSRINKNPETAL